MTAMVQAASVDEATPPSLHHGTFGAGERVGSPLVDLVNTVGSSTTRWCTPSVLPAQHRVSDPYANDISVSVSGGSALAHTGVFAQAEEFIADCHGAHRVFLSPSGSTAANQVVIRALARMGLAGQVLIDRQCHHSVTSGLAVNQRAFRFVSGGYHGGFDAPRALTARDVERALDRWPNPAALVVVSPTYLGEIADLSGIIEVVRRRSPGTIVHVDEAWGSHLAFHPLTRQATAIRAGADSASQSTHKQAGALQPGAVLLVNEGRLDPAAVDGAYRDIITTSGSYLTMASIDAAHRVLANDGHQLLGRSINATSRLEELVCHQVSGVRVFDEAVAQRPVDATKITLGVDRCGWSGYQLAHQLAQQGIIVEKATAATVTLLTTFCIDDDSVHRTGTALATCLLGPPPSALPPAGSLGDPFCTLDPEPHIESSNPGFWSRPTETVRLSDAAGRIAGEDIEAYPPGIALMVSGYEITQVAVEAVCCVAAQGGTVIASDPTAESVRVLA